MTASVDIVNRALQSIGARTNVSATELANLTSNEAIQANSVLASSRDEVLRLAPWNCAKAYANAVLITSIPGTPENLSQSTFQTWQPGLPVPPWAYEYQYPVDCIRMLYVVPQFTSGFASSVPITTAITGGAPAIWMGPPQRYQVSTDKFFPVTQASIASGGSGYNTGDFITLARGPITSPPIGAPVIIGVVATAGVVTNTAIFNQIQGEVGSGGSYFAPQTNPVAQGSTTGSGTGATFNLTFGPQNDQRVILTNQEQALLCFVKQVTDINVMDGHFQEAWVQYLGAKLALVLTGDKGLANGNIQKANNIIIEARKSDGNEGLTVYDTTPDWIRARGIAYPSWEISPNVVYDWGPLLTTY
jgi:hypothetical protein